MSYSLPDDLHSFIRECLVDYGSKTLTKSCEQEPDCVSSFMATSSHTRRHSTLITNTVNENGELLDTQEVGIDILVKGQEEFFFLFAKHLGTLLLLDGNEIKTLLWCSMHAHLGTNEIVLNKAIKQRLADAAGISPRSVDNSLTKLCKKKMLHRVETGVYLVNPDATWKGKINEKAKTVKLFVNYTIE